MVLRVMGVLDYSPELESKVGGKEGKHFSRKTEES